STSSAIKNDLQQIEESQKAKDRQIYEQKSKEWLKMLDPLSGEGLWFEEFAKNYPSKLEAAIALMESK
ncbi:MAG: salt stress protein, Slr1339 family, partial [Pseudanabaena sp.]